MAVEVFHASDKLPRCFRGFKKKKALEKAMKYGFARDRMPDWLGRMGRMIHRRVSKAPLVLKNICALLALEGRS